MQGVRVGFKDSSKERPMDDTDELICHSEPFAVILNGAKRSEESRSGMTETGAEILCRACPELNDEILRCAQNDEGRRTQDDKAKNSE